MPKYLDGTGLARFWDNIQDQIGSASQEQVDAWLTAHPEATTTVQDGSITEAKLAAALANALVKGRGYVADTNLTDANQAERNSIIVINNKSSVSNLPSGLQTEGCMLITLGNGKNASVNSVAFQLCLTISKEGTEVPVMGFWYRSRWGASISAWSTWVCVYSSTDGNISTSGINDLAVTGAKLADGAVNADKLADGAVNADKLESAFLKKLLVAQPWVTSESGEFDANTVTRGTVYLITTSATVTNFPEGAGANPRGFLVSLASGTTNVSATSPTFQLFAEVTDLASSKVWYRSRWGAAASVWSDWQQLVTTDNVMELINRQALADVSMFRKVGVLGDSFASGSMYVNDEFIKQDYEQSWPMNLSRQHGVEIVRYSSGGWGAYNWLHNTGSYGLDKFETDVANDNVCGLYIIAFGINDSNSNMTFGGVSGGADYLGSSADVNTSDYTQNANTYWGQMGRIISTIQSEVPSSRIVLTTLARENSATRRSFTEAVKDMGTYYGVPVLYLYGDAFFTSDYWVNGFDGGHPTAPMYSGMAVAINRLLAQSMGDNYSYFRAYTGV